MNETEPQAPMQASWIMPGGFHAFEYEWALPAAFEFHRRIGRARIAARIRELNALCKQELAKMPKIRLYTPRSAELSAGIVCFDVEGMKAAEVVRRLHEKRVLASTSPYRDSCARVAPSLMNTPAEIETALRHIRALG
jgi:selenocysteine lyase/cysteine desulfurase